MRLSFLLLFLLLSPPVSCTNSHLRVVATQTCKMNFSRKRTGAAFSSRNNLASDSGRPSPIYESTASTYPPSSPTPVSPTSETMLPNTRTTGPAALSLASPASSNTEVDLRSRPTPPGVPNSETRPQAIASSASGMPSYPPAPRAFLFWSLSLSILTIVTH